MSKIIPLAIALVIFLASCSGQAGSDSPEFKKEIPGSGSGAPNLFYQLAQQKAQQLKLDTLQSGYDSLQIRIWYDYSLIDLRELLVLKHTASAWTATYYTMTIDRNSSDLTETVASVKTAELNPKNGWGSFVNGLLALQIMTLPDMNDIPGLEDGWTDGITYNVEVATEKQYRFYGYHLPNQFQDKYWQAKNMVDILKLVEAEFGITSGI